MLTSDKTPPLKGKGSKLSTKMNMFVEEYFVDLNASAACLRAGYKTKAPNRLAGKLMSHPLVKEAINGRKKERIEETRLSAEYVINKLIAIADKQEEINASASLRALELLGKHLGLYRDRQEISGPDGEAIQVQQEQIRQNVDEFTRSIERLASRNSGKTGTDGEGNVVEFPNGRRES
jgi:phage terminase small subunit